MGVSCQLNLKNNNNYKNPSRKIKTTKIFMIPIPKPQSD